MSFEQGAAGYGREALGDRIGAVIVPRVHVAGPVPDAPYLKRYPPAGLIAFGRDPADGRTLPGLADRLAELRALFEELGLERPFACCDLEEGAGLHFEDATRLPPALALAAADEGRRGRGGGEPDWILSAGCLTGLEARARGVELVLGPVVDVASRPENPIIAVRSFGDEPARVAARARSFATGLRLGGVGSCLKHFPGHGDTAADSHTELPRLDLPEDRLQSVELLPYRELLAPAPAAASGCVMVGHLDVPALTGSEGLPTSLSRRVVAGLLQQRLGFGGAVLADGMDMGALRSLRHVHTRALYAGCHGLLCPADPEEAAIEVFEAAENPELEQRASWMNLEYAARRMFRLREALQVRDPAAGEELPAEVHPGARPGAYPAERLAFAAELAAACLCLSPGGLPWTPGAPYELTVLSGEAGEGGEARLLSDLAGPGAAGTGGTPPLVLAVPCRVSAGRGRAGLRRSQVQELHQRLDAARRIRRPACVLWFGSPQVLPPVPEGTAVLTAFAPSPPLVEAAGRVLRGSIDAGGALPVRPPRDG